MPLIENVSVNTLPLIEPVYWVCSVRSSKVIRLLLIDQLPCSVWVAPFENVA